MRYLQKSTKRKRNTEVYRKYANTNLSEGKEEPVMGGVYEIVKDITGNYECIVIPTAITNPLENIEILISQLNQEHIHSGSIIFDFIMSSGNTKERYAEVLYDDGFINDSFHYVEIPPNGPIREMCSKHLLKRIDEGKVTVLNGTQLSLLRNGFL